MKAVKLPSGKWRARAYNKYTQKQKSFCADSKKEAERLARQFEYSVKVDSATDMTFGEAYDMYIAAHPEWSEKTKVERTRYKETRYKDLLNVPLSQMTDEFMQVWIDKTFSEVTGKTASNQITPIRATLKRYRPHTALCITTPKIIRPKLNMPTEANVVALLKAVEDTRFCVPVYLGAFAAMRRGEIAALDLDHIDFNKREIYVEHSLGVGFDREWALKPPKNGQPRKIRVPQLVIDKIKEKGLTPIVNPDVFSADYGDFLEAQNLPHFRFHDLRHYCAARMMSSNPPIPISVIQKYGGWRDKKVLLEIYDYVIAEIDEASMDNWNAQAELVCQKLDTKLDMKSETL